MASVTSTTPTGTEESSSVLLPSCPSSFLPQQDIVLSWWSAQECPPPAEMAVAPTKTEGVSAFGLSESLEQLEASKAAKISRERGKKLPEDALFMGNELSTRIYNISCRRPENAIRVLQLDS